jgi:hypothetical protein
VPCHNGRCTGSRTGTPHHRPGRAGPCDRSPSETTGPTPVRRRDRPVMAARVGPLDPTLRSRVRQRASARHTAFSVCLTPKRGQVGLNVTRRCSYLKTCRGAAVNAYQP